MSSNDLPTWEQCITLAAGYALQHELDQCSAMLEIAREMRAMEESRDYHFNKLRAALEEG